MSQSEGTQRESLADSDTGRVFQYEGKRAGFRHEQMLAMCSAAEGSTANHNPNNSYAGTAGTYSGQSDGIKNVQIHKSKLGKETRVETELQSCGQATDLNINIIMDSRSNMSNGADSIEYEAQGSVEMPAPEQGGQFSDEGESRERRQPAQQPVSSREPQDRDDGDEGDSRSPSSPRHDRPRRPTDEVDDNDEEEGEGEGDLDDAMKHFQRYLNGENVDLLRGPNKEDEVKETMKKLPTGHLEKEGIVIGCMSIFADVHVKEYLVMLSDDTIQAFLVDPERFRSVANRTSCEIEVTRRILNRRMGKLRWLKYLVVAIRGPSYSSIDQCDKMMSMWFPPFKWRKPYGRPAALSFFLKESTPDNADLYFNYQRTGPCQQMFGELKLRTPFRSSKLRPVEQTPWKMVQKRQQWGLLDPKNDRMEKVMSHVYPERGGSLTLAMDREIKWADAAAEAVLMSKNKDLARTQLLNWRKMNSEPLFTRAAAE